MAQHTKYTTRDTRYYSGFTLIELIITIAILAIILTIVVVALNPAEQLQRSRDAKRVADLSAMNSAWNLYLAQATTTINMAEDNGCVDQGGTRRYYVSRATTTSTPTGFDAVATSTNQSVGASGWAPTRIDQTPGGAAISVLPIDPAGPDTTVDFWYAYACNQDGRTFEFTARLESSYFNTDLNVPGTDGGNSASTYETGNNLELIPNTY